MKRMACIVGLAVVSAPVCFGAPPLRTIFPQMVVGGGWTTTVILSNNDPSATWTYSVRVRTSAILSDATGSRYLPPDGLMIDGELSETGVLDAFDTGEFLGPRQTRTHVLGRAAGPPVAGWLEVVSDETVSVTVFYRLQATDGRTLLSVGVLPVESCEPCRQGRPGTAHALSVPVLFSDDSNTGVAVVPQRVWEEPAGKPFHVDLTLYGADGAMLERRSLVIGIEGGASDGYGHYARLANEIFPEHVSGEFSGTMKIEPRSFEDGVSAIALLLHRGPGNEVRLTSLPAYRDDR